MDQPQQPVTPPVIEGETPIHPPVEPRRGFFRKAMAIAAGSVAFLIPAGAGLAVFLDPLRRKGGKSSFIPVTSLDALPTDGTPRRFTVALERTDVWTKSQGVGAVYLRRVGDTVHALNVRCPHAGCPVDWTAEGKFACPCHNSKFERDGEVTPDSVSPRGLDPLEVAVSDGQVSVKFQEFLAGTHDRIVKG